MIKEVEYYLDGFSGYGGFRHAFELAGWKFGKVWFSEIDKYAIANYKYNFPNSNYAGSITDVSGLPKLDLFTFGWPCQDNSIAGKRKGQTDGTRSGLLFSAISCIERFQPRNFVAENVKGLQSVNGGIDIIESLKILSYLNDSCPQYDIEMQLLNTRWFLPQNRERLFFVGHLRTDGESKRKIFPIGENDFNPFKSKFRGVEISTENTANCLNARMAKMGRDDTYILCDSMQGRRLEERETFPPLRANTGAGHGNYVVHNLQARNGKGKGGKGYLTKSDGAVYCIDSVNNQAVNEKGRIRRLTPIECERLQGLPDNWTRFGTFEGVVKEISDTQRYHLCGNGVSIPVVKAIAEKLKYLV